MIVHRLLDVVNVDVVAEDGPPLTLPSPPRGRGLGEGCVLASFSSVGVPVKPMNEARGKGSRMWQAGSDSTACSFSGSVKNDYRLFKTTTTSRRMRASSVVLSSPRVGGGMYRRLAGNALECRE